MLTKWRKAHLDDFNFGGSVSWRGNIFPSNIFEAFCLNFSCKILANRNLLVLLKGFHP